MYEDDERKSDGGSSIYYARDFSKFYCRAVYAVLLS